MQCFNADESVIDVSIGSHEEPGVLDYNLSYYSDVPVGYVFARGPNVYASEAGGTTFYAQEAIPVPVLSQEHPNVIDYPVSSSSAAPVGYQFFRGPNIYSTEIGGTSFFLQEAIPIPVLSSSELIESSNLSDISHPSLPTSSVVLDHENIESPNSAIRNSEGNGKVEQIHSVKSKEVCKSEKNKIIKTGVKNREAKPKQLVDYTCSEEHKIYISSEEICNLETSNKIKPEVQKIRDKEKHSLKNHNCVESTDVSKSEGVEKVTKSVCSKDSFKCNEVCNSEKNKKKKKKSKKRKLKIKESVVTKESVKNNEVCNLDLNESIQKSEAETSSVKSDELYYSKVNVKESSDFNDVGSENCKKTKRKCKKRQSKFKESVEIKECAINDEIFNLDLNDTAQKSEQHRASFKSDELCNSKVNGKESSEVGNSEKNKKKKRKNRKRKPKVKKSVEIKESVESVEIFNLDLNETPEKNVCYEKYLSESTNNVILNFDEHQEIDTETVYIKDDSNLDSSEKDALLAEKIEITTTHIDSFDKSSEVSTVVVIDDVIKSVDSFPVRKSEASDFDEVDFQKTAEEQREKSKINFSGTVEYFYENNNSIFELSEPKSICVDGKEKLNSVHQDHGNSKTSRSSSVEQFHSHYNPIFELLDPNSVCSNGNIEVKHFGQDIVNFKESVSSTKTEELSDRNFHVPSQQSNSRLALPVRESEIPCGDTSISTASREIKKKKKRFQKVRKWFTDLCSCMRKNKE